MPQKLDDCVAQVKGKKGVDNAYAICNAQLGKETKEDHNPLDIPFGSEQKTREDHATIKRGKVKIPMKSKQHSLLHGKDLPHSHVKTDNGKKQVTRHNAEIAEAIIQEKINANRQVPYSNPPITNRPVEPDIQKTTKGIGGQVGKIDSSSNTNNMTTDLWKKILDNQLKRNVKEPRY